MNIGMFLHVRFLVEPLAAVLARVGPGVRMYEQVSGQGGGPLEGLPALFALEGPLCSMDGPVLTQADLVTERLVAQFAGKGPLAAVGTSGVHLQAVGRAEHLIAFHT
ncbi:hypothetical protein TNIN_362821 [Trichonephila inaurata madagascariensis]|uniref:Uncharacterized protein n=1 Tax=Trichonephila inaurata madagascariensis TaxID=2747483 RepID=A0A8X7BPL7_9ARAC|nr:hypothetical protein TNIN_362821 [Trichonephila inaurata madagascariensis]